MKAVEVWINGEKKCTAGADRLTAFVDVTRYSTLRIAGMTEKEEGAFHVHWPHYPLQIGDEVRIRLIETDEVDVPSMEGRYQTQSEEDQEIRTRLLNVRAMLPVGSAPTASATFDERMKQQNFIAAMQILGDLGERADVSASYWKQLGDVASLLRRHD